MDVDRIAGTFKDQVVFMTGATGFMGKVFLERLLRLTEVRNIFVLIRLKRDKNSEERLLEIFDNPLFDKLKTLMSLTDILAKVHAIVGDCSYKDLSLSPADRAIIANHSTMFFHFAATVKFNEKFKRAIELNVRGTREMVKLALECPHLKLFCQVSTAFCHLHEKHLLEKSYDPVADPHEIIDIAERFNEEMVEKLMRKYLCKDVPNSYVFTKGLSESLVAIAHEKFKLPLLLCRPAIINSMFRDPIPGWTDNLNNMNGIFAAAGLGILRTYIMGPDTVLNVLPVDYATDNIICCAWDYVTHHQGSIHVVNLEYEPVRVAEVWPFIMHVLTEENPFAISLWYPNCTLGTNWPVYYIESFLFELIPALLVDGILWLIGKKPILTRANTRITKEIDAIRTFIDNKWSFEQTNIRVIQKLMNALEAEKYSTECRDREAFVRRSTLGIRKYVFKQDESTIGASRRRIKILYIIDRSIKLALLAGLIYYLSNTLLRYF